MPQPHATSSAPNGYNMNSQSTGMPAGVPFGAGWIAPTQHPHQQQQAQQYQQHQQYQQSHMAPYPTTSSHTAAPYPTGHNGAAAPYPTNTPYPHTAPYPSNQPPYPPGGNYGSAYPGSSYPHNPQQSAYPSSSSSLHYHNPHYNNTTQNHPTSYNPQHGYTPVRTSSGLESPAGNIQHCFEELAQRQGHPIQHHFMQRKEVSVFAKKNQTFYFFLLFTLKYFFKILVQIKISL